MYYCDRYTPVTRSGTTVSVHMNSGRFLKHVLRQLQCTLNKTDGVDKYIDSTGNEEDIKSAKIGGIVIEGTRVNKIKN
jgi:hypothetical protein